MRFPDDAPPVAIPWHRVDLDAPTVADGLGLAVRPVGSERIEREEIRAAAGAALDGLHVRNRVIVGLRFGLDGGRPLDFVEIGAALRVSRQAVHAAAVRVEPAFLAAVAAALRPRGRR